MFRRQSYKDDWLRSTLQGLSDLQGIFFDHLMMVIPLSGMVSQQKQGLSWLLVVLGSLRQPFFKGRIVLSKGSCSLSLKLLA